MPARYQEISHFGELIILNLVFIWLKRSEHICIFQFKLWNKLEAFVKKENTGYVRGVSEKVLHFNFENQGPYNFWDLGATTNLVAKDGVLWVFSTKGEY